MKLPQAQTYHFLSFKS